MTKQKVAFRFVIKSEALHHELSNLRQTLIVSGNATTTGITKPTNTNQFDYANLMLAKQITQTMSVTNPKVTQIAANKLPVSLSKKFSLKIAEIRAKVVHHLSQLPQPLRGLSLMLIVGVNDLDFAELKQSIVDLGVIFLFCLSGLHVFYLTMMIKRLFAWLFISQETTAWVLLVVLPVYALIGGAATSLVRATAMVWLKLALQKCGVKIATLTAWSWILLATVLLNPYVVFTMGFQLSYLLTLALLLANKLAFWQSNCWLNALSVPILLWHTYQINWLMFLVTLVFIPVFARVIMPAVLVGAAVGWLAPLANMILKVIMQVVVVMAKLPTTLTYGKMPLIIVISLLLIILSIPLWRANRAKIVGSVALVSLLGMGALMQPRYDRIIFFDIGQGDSALIIKQNNVTLIDTGGQLKFAQEKWQKPTTTTDAGISIIANYLQSCGIGRIDQLILTHQDSDHTGYLPSIAQKIAIKRIYVPAGMEQNPGFIARMKAAKLPLNNVEPILVRSRQAINATTQLKSSLPAYLQVLHPFAAGSGKNNDSLVIKTTHDHQTFLLTGDLEQAGERAMMTQFGVDADVLKVGHHGSKTSTASDFVAAVKPKIAIISAGRNNRYNHPHAETLTTLAAHHVSVLSTQTAGMIEFSNKTIKLPYKNNAQYNLETSKR